MSDHTASPSTLAHLDRNTLESMLARARQAGQYARATQLREYLAATATPAPAAHTCHGARFVGTPKAVAERMCPADHSA